MLFSLNTKECIFTEFSDNIVIVKVATTLSDLIVTHCRMSDNDKMFLC